MVCLNIGELFEVQRDIDIFEQEDIFIILRDKDDDGDYFVKFLNGRYSGQRAWFNERYIRYVERVK